VGTLTTGRSVRLGVGVGVGDGLSDHVRRDFRGCSPVLFASLSSFCARDSGSVTLMRRLVRFGRPLGLLWGWGESVQMEILYSGRWRTIEVLPTNSKGRWTYR
jgi:hypothetical protein